MFHICTDTGEVGYGQSLLQKQSLVFDTEGDTLPATPSKAKMLEKLRGVRGSKISMDTVRTSTTLVGGEEGGTLRPGSLFSYVIDHRRGTDTSGSEHTLRESQVNVHVDHGDRRGSMRSGRSVATSVPSEFLPEESIPDAYDTDKLVQTPSDTGMSWVSGGSGSVASLPETVAKREFGHERKHSYDTKTSVLTGRKSSLTTISDEPASPISEMSENLLARRDSRGSHGTSSMTLSASRQSSLTSPILRRLSSQVFEGSTQSMTGSADFYSAAETLSEASVPSCSSKDRSGNKSPISPLARQNSQESDQASLFYQSLSTTGSQTILHNTVLRRPGAGPSSSGGTPGGSLHEYQPLTDESETESESGSWVSAQSSIPNPSIYEDATPRGSRSLSNIPEIRDHTPGRESGSGSHDTKPEYVPLSEEEYDLEPGDDHQSANFVDLRGQVNQPITKSPLLMNCYINHMTQLQCSHWSSPPPLPQHFGKMANIHQEPSTSTIHNHSNNKFSPSVVSDHGPSTAWIPHFAYRHEGFGPAMMLNKKEPKTPPSLSSPSSASDWDKPGRFFPGSAEGMDMSGKYTL